MNNQTSTLKQTFSVFLILVLTLCLSMPQRLLAQSYCTPNSYYGCGNGGDIGTLERVQLKELSGKLLYDKAADGCNAGSSGIGKSFTLISSTPSFTLVAGTRYSLGASVSSVSGKTVLTYTKIQVAAWIDYNQDGNFSSSEYIATGWGSATAANGTGVGGNIYFNNFTLPCTITTGTSRLRIITSYYYPIDSTQSCPKGAGSSYYYGEQEDYTITLAASPKTGVGFSMPGSALVGTIVKLINSYQQGYVSHQWDINDDGSIDYTTTNVNHIFKDTGKICVRLKSRACTNKDSLLKCILIKAPTSKPQADFISSKNKIERFETIDFMDLSTAGPIYWTWYMYDPSDSIATRSDIETYNSNLKGGDPYVNASPAVFFNRTGNYTVCLSTANSLGTSNLICKKNYVKVTPLGYFIMGQGTIQPIYEQYGEITDDGGPNAHYPDNSPGMDYATIIPCNAKKITLVFTQFKLDAGDYLRIYDGVNANGKPLHTGNGFTDGKAPTVALTAYSGAIYLVFSKNGKGNDAGFIANWTTERGPSKPPVADFIIPDTLYQSVPYKFINTSLNVLSKTDWVWDIDPYYGEVAYTKELNFTFTKDTNYNVTLRVTTCSGTEYYTKQVVVKTPHTKVDMEMIADNQRPLINDTINLKAFNPKKGKALQANRFLWSFSPNRAKAVNGTSFSDPESRLAFDSVAKYTINLCGWNSLDSAGTYNCITKKEYVIIYNPCTPAIGSFISADVAITNVTMIDARKNTLIDNNSGSAYPGYTDYSSSLSATIFQGGEYEMSISRITIANYMTRKIWIDWNADGDFSDAGELVGSEVSSISPTFNSSFKVPDCSKTFYGKTRMRIGVSYNNDPNEPCGALSGITNANRIGEFEDYGIIIADDMMPPVLTINNNDTIYQEKGTPYIEYGAKAIDTTEGDISSRIIITSNVRTDSSGTYYVTYTVIDAACNQAIPIIRTVIVGDFTAPNLQLKGSDTVYLNVNIDRYVENGATAIDNVDGDISKYISIKGSVDTSVIGTYFITYSVKDAAGNKSQKQRVVIVRDILVPLISNSLANKDNIVTVDVLTVFTDHTVVKDNYDKPVLIISTGSAGMVDTKAPGVYPLTYNAVDGSGNRADELTIKYVVDDYTPPTIFFHSPDTIIWKVNKAYQSPKVTVTDNYYGDSLLTISHQVTVNGFKLGLYSDIYTAKDKSGNIAVKTLWVKVVDEEVPVITGSSICVRPYAYLDPSTGLKLMDNYYSPAVLKPLVKIIFNNVDIYTEGIYVVTFQVTDPSGNISLPFERIIWVDKFCPLNALDLQSNEAVKVYPNPSSGHVNITAVYEASEITISNAIGSVLKSCPGIYGANGFVSLDLSELPDGIYFIRVVGHERTSVKSFMLRR